MFHAYLTCNFGLSWNKQMLNLKGFLEESMPKEIKDTVCILMHHKNLLKNSPYSARGARGKMKSKQCLCWWYSGDDGVDLEYTDWHWTWGKLKSNGSFYLLTYPLLQNKLSMTWDSKEGLWLEWENIGKPLSCQRCNNWPSCQQRSFNGTQAIECSLNSPPHPWVNIYSWNIYSKSTQRGIKLTSIS